MTKLPCPSLYHMVLSWDRITNVSAPRWWSAVGKAARANE